MSEDTPPRAGRYHHGDLKQALLQAGLDILETEGIAALTLRKIAARAGVSHAAPAHHFATLSDLLTALAAIAFRRFDSAMREERDKVPAGDAHAQAIAACNGYVRFARSNPGLFRLMFDVRRLNWQTSEFGEAAKAAARQLTEIAAPYAGHFGSQKAAEHIIWSTVHGFVNLQLDYQIPPDAPLPDFVGLLTPGMPIAGSPPADPAKNCES